MVNKSELKYIIWSMGFALVWFVWLMPYLVGKFDGNSPITQFLLFNLGLYVFFFIFLKSITTSTNLNIKTAFGLTALFFAIDCLMPEYHVLTNGTLVQGATLGMSTSDYVVGLLMQKIGLSGFMVYFATYIIIPGLLLYISAKLLPNFIKYL